MPSYTKLNGISDCDQVSELQSLEENLLSFFEWGLLEAGGYDDVENDTLYPVHIPGIDDGRIWQANFRNWVWEDGLESTRQPIPISGVYVNSTFIPTTGNTFTVNYPDGRINFNTAIPASSTVQATYSYKWVNFYTQNVPWFRDVIFDAYRFEVGIDTPVSGFVNLLQRNSVQLPCIVLETISDRRFVPRQLGDGSQFLYQDFMFHILAENASDRSFLTDVITLQKDKTILLYNVNSKNADNQMGLDWHGNKIQGAKNYPQLLNDYLWKKAIFHKTVAQDNSAKLPLFRSTIRVTLEVDFMYPYY